MSDPLINSSYNPKVSEDLISQKIAILKAASAAKTAQLTVDYENAVALRAAGGGRLDIQADPLRTAADVAIKLGQGVVGLGQAAVGIGSLVTGGLVGEGMQAIGYRPEELKASMGEGLSGAQQRADAKVQQAQGFVDTLKTALTNPRSILGSVAESTPGMLAGMGVVGAVARGIGTKAALAATEGMVGDAAMIKAVGDAAAQKAIQASSGQLLATSAGVEGAQTTGQIVDQAQSAGKEYGDYALPAVGAGLTTAAISLGANKIFGDAATDIATGTKTLKGTYLAKVAKEGFSEGVAEELPQSAQEQVFTNIAMGEDDYTKGVGNAAAMGMVAGVAMGVGMGSLHKSDNSKAVEAAKKQNTVERQQTFNAAANNNDITAFTNPNSPDYDLSRGMGALRGNSMKADTTPEAKEANLKQAGALLAKLEEQHAAAKEAMEDRSPASVTLYQGMLDGVKTKIAAADPKNTAAMVKLVEQRDTLVEHIADISNKKEASAASLAFYKIDQQLNSGRTSMNDLVNSNHTVATPEEVSTLVAKVDTPALADTVINLSMIQPDSMSDEQALKLADDTSNTLTTEQRSHLRAFSAARIAQNNVSTTSKVSNEIMFGSSENVGIIQYRARIAAAIAAGSQAAATRSLDQLSAFSTGHAQKVRLALQALASGNEQQLVKTATQGWELQPAGTLTKTKLEKNGGLTIHRNSGALISDMQKEAAALKSVTAEMKSATALKFSIANNQVAAVQSAPAPAITDTSDISNSLFRENERERDEKVVDKSTTSLPTVSSRPVVKEVKAKTPAKPEAAQQPAAVSVANPAPVAEAATAEAEVISESPISSPAASASSSPASATGLPTVATLPPVSPSPASSPDASAAETTPKAKTTTLSVFDTEHDKTKPYTEQNLIGTQFVQTAGNEDTGTQRPLAKTVDFLTALKNKVVKVSDFVQQKTDFSDEQRAVVRAFLASATAWTGNIMDNLKLGNFGYGYKDQIQFLLKEDANGKPDLDENVKTAISYAAYSWIAENAARPAINDKAEINLILNRSEDALVSPAEENALSHIGTRQNVVLNSIGQRIVASLGLKALATAPRNVQADLEASLGAHAMKLLLDQGILVRTTITGPEMAELTKSKDTSLTAKFYFLSLARTDNVLNEKAEAIYQNSKGTHGILDKLFGVESALKEPSQTPIKGTQKTTRNTSQGIPSELEKQVAADDATPSMVRDDMVNLVGQISADIMLQIAGKEEGGTTVHKSRRMSVEAKNNGLVRELDRFMGYVGQMGSDVLMHFEHSVWMQQRVGIATNMINPQTSKIHRNFLYRADWETTIDTKDTVAMTNFKLRVAEGLGVKTDKKNKEKALADFAGLMVLPEIKGAVNVLVKSLEGSAEGRLTDNEQQILLEGVNKGGENMHSLSALMALAQYKLAIKEGKLTFVSQMMAEVDGVTNGPMLSHLLLGAASSVREMYALLNRGGFFEQGNTHTEYNNWRDAPGNFDLYENTALHMTQAINAAKLDKATMNALYAFTGELADSKGVVQKAGRNIIKTPLTAMVFGSSINNAVDSMADNFIEAIYAAIEDSANGKKNAMQPEQILQNLGQLGINLPANVELMEYEFSARQVKTLKGMFKGTLGKAVESTMETDFKVFIEQRTEFNKTAQLNFEVYNAVYTGMREAKIIELVVSGEMAINPTTKEPVHDLTNAQEKALRKEIEALAPIMHSPMSKESGELKAGLLVAKSARKLSTNAAYKNEVKFGTPFADGSKSTLVHGYEVTPTGPGVAMVPVGMHSADSAISVRANPKGKALNVHDAQGHGVGGIIATAQAMNKATWDTMLNYSPAAEITAALLRTVQGLDAMMKTGTLPDVVITKLASSLVDFAVKHEVPAEGVLFLQAELAHAMAYRADVMKLDTMVTMQAVNQYAMEGGAYAVTSDNRASAASLRSALAPSLSSDASSALTSVSGKLDAAIKAELAKREGSPATAKAKPVQSINTNPLAKLGKPVGKHDAKLTAVFKAKPNQTVKEVVALLRKTMKDGFSMKLLSQLERTIDGKLTVKYITKDTVPADVLLTPVSQNAAGMYLNLKAGTENQAIYVMSDDFVKSGLSEEVLLHEMVHAALTITVRAEQAERDGEITRNEGEKPAKPYTSNALKLVEELEALMALAKQSVADSGVQERIDYYSRAFENLDEFIAYGMTNREFQNDVMATITYTTKTAGNPLITAMKDFIDKITALFFGRPNAMMSTGMEAFLSNVSGLFEQSSLQQAKSIAPVVLNVTPGTNNIRDLSTMDIYAALEQNNNGATVSAVHSAHLQGLLNTIVKAIHGPFGSFKAALMEQTAQDPLDVYTEALQTGKAPFASETLGAGFAFTGQEAFVLEQVEASMRAALESKDGVMTVAYKELTKLYSEVQAKLNIESFHQGDWATATLAQKAEAKALYDFIFTIKQDATGKSDYMARFAALGLVHSGFRDLMAFHTADNAAPANMSFNERLNRIFNTVMSWFAGKMTSTFRGQRADHKLNSLVQQIIGIEAKRKNKLGHQNAVLNAVSNTAEDMTASVRTSVEKFGNLPFFQNSGNAFIKLAGNTLSAVAGDRVDAIMEGYLKLRDKTMTGQLGVAAALVNEVRGATESTKIYQYLLRATKHLEGQRKDAITHISQAVTRSFVNDGEDLKEQHNKALTAVVLRGDMQALLGDPLQGKYTIAQLHDMVNDRTIVQTEITAQEALLTGPMRRFYTTSAKALGFYLATGKITVAHQLFNAYNIARVQGTGMSNRVTEADAQVAEKILDRLASLYAIKYAEKNDIKALREVFTAEAARTDGGHGIEMVMKQHTALQAESKDKLFAGSETMRMKGYVPEVYDPYMSVVMATDAEGAELELRGYVPMPGYLGQDDADTFTDRKRIYSIRDGGMKQWNSGIFSVTDSRAKGNRVIQGASPISAAGQQNAASMAAISAGKHADIQAMFTNTAFDPLQIKATYMAPVISPNGTITNYRYMMSNNVKDNLLNRDNRTGKLLGVMAGSTFDKVTSKVQNRNAVQALHEQYMAEYAENAESYLTVGPNSPDPQLREIWKMLPWDTQQQAKSLFGQQGMKVRNDVLDINFGYRKLSIGTVFDKEAAQRNFVEGMFVEIMTHAFGEKAQLRTRQTEDIWQAIVKETKANLVVKSWSTMTGNLRSNWSQLFMMGVSPVQIFKSHRVAFKAAWEYKKDNAKLFSLKNQQQINHYAPGTTAAQVAYQIKRLEDSLARNPIRPLIDAGLMPTIVEDVNVDEDMYSYKSRFTEKIDGAVEAVNPHILKGLQLLTMHHSTAPYKVMSYATQISDFLARYTLYQHDISKKNPLTHEQAVQRASESFINYDVPTHRKVQYANDSGLIMFSKYYIRIQKILARIYKDSPGRVLAMMAAEHMLGDQPTVLDSGFTHHFGNPFNGGALSYFSSLDSVTSVALITGPFTTAVYNGQ